MNIYDEIGVKKIINTLGNSTVLGGNTPSGEVKEAIESASNNYVSMQELTDTCRKLVADLIGSESALITPGAASALSLATAGAMTGTDRTLIEQIPDTTGMKNEVIIQTQLRVPYDKAIEVAGAKLIEVGSAEKTSVEHITNAINKNTLAIHYLPGGESVASSGKHTNALDIETVIKIAKDNNIYVIVDAAGQVYPTDNLTKYIKMGADAVAYGAKYFGAPHSSGIVVGKKEYVDKVKAQSFIAYQLEGRNAMGRTMKLDRQEVIGAVVALEQWLKMNHEDRFSVNIKKQESIAAEINTISGVSSEVTEIPTFIKYSLKVNVDPNVMSAKQLADELANGNPRIMVSPPEDPNAHVKSDITAAGHGIETGNNFLLINTSEVSESQISQISNRIKEILSK